MERKSIIGLLGAGLLVVGVFLPMISMPIIGSINYFRNGQGDGIIILALAVVSIIFTLAKKYRWLLFTGASSIALLSYTLYNLYSGLADAKSKMQSDLADNPFKGLASLAAESIQLEWGWAVMLVGSVMLLLAAFVPNAEQLDSMHSDENEGRQPCLYCAEEIKVEASVCRFCGREQPEDALPEEINCPACDVNLILDSKERLERKFACVECGYQTGQTFTLEDDQTLSVTN